MRKLFAVVVSLLATVGFTIGAGTTPIAGLKLIGDANGNNASLTNVASVAFVDGTSITGTSQFASAAQINALSSTQIVVKGAISGVTNLLAGKVDNNNGFATNLTMVGSTLMTTNTIIAGSLVVSNGISGSGAGITGLPGSSVVGSVNSSLNSGAACIYDVSGNGIVLTSTNGAQRWSIYLTNNWVVSISPAMIADQQFDLALSYNTSNWVVTLPAGTKMQQGVTSLAITNTTGFLDQLSICCIGTNATLGVTTTNAYRSAGTQ